MRRTIREQSEPKKRVRNLPKYASETKAPPKVEMLEVPFHIVTTLTKKTPSKLYFVRKYTVMFAIKLIDANFSNDSFASIHEHKHQNKKIKPDEVIHINIPMSG